MRGSMRWSPTLPATRHRMPPKIAKLAGLGALAACAGIAALFLLFVYGTRPTESAGMDGTTRFLSWLSVAGVLLALLGVHVLLGRRLLSLARGDRSSA